MAETKRAVTKATKPFKAKMKKVIRDEARLLSLIAGQLVTANPPAVSKDDSGAAADNLIPVCKGPGHCAIGALMYAAGISNKRIARFEAGDPALGNYAQGPVARILFDTYHIDDLDANAIITGNDAISNHWWGTKDDHARIVQTRMQEVFDTIDNLDTNRERLRPSAKVDG